jgi:hypothetical protein
MKIASGVMALALLGYGGACNAQLAGVTPEMIASALPEAGAPAAGAPRVQATAANLTAAIDWAERENARAGSSLLGKIALQQVAVMGQSCGGVLAITLGADPLMKLHGPVLLINGHERDFMMGRSRATYDAIENLPAFYGSRHGA